MASLVAATAAFAPVVAQAAQQRAAARPAARPAVQVRPRAASGPALVELSLTMLSSVVVIAEGERAGSCGGTRGTRARAREP